MRTLLIVLLLLLAPPVAAQEWGYYVDELAGYEIDVPPGFTDGPIRGERIFMTPTAMLRTSARQTNSLEEWVDGQIVAMEMVGRWTLTAKTVTPDHSDFDATNGARRLHSRAILYCRYKVAEFRFEYMEADTIEMQKVIDRLVASLKPTGTC